MATGVIGRAGKPYAADYFTVEGNIGAGKSTFLKVINKHLPIQVVAEPCYKWQHVEGGQSLLDNFYKDAHRWAYTFQSYAFITRIMEQTAHAKTNTHARQLLERSVFSDRYCFAQNSFELGYMSELEWLLYREWFSYVIDTYVSLPRGFIYLRTTPEISHERIAKRNRSEESLVSLDYLKSLHDRHENWLIHNQGIDDRVKQVPVLVLDVDNDFESNPHEAEQHVEKIMSFLSMHDASLMSNRSSQMTSL